MRELRSTSWLLLKRTVTSLNSNAAVNTMCEKILSRDRVSISQAITLIESTRSDQRAFAQELLMLLLKRNQQTQSIRIGFSGAPGVGKSTFLECFGNFLLSMSPNTKVALRQPSNLAILTVDPTSQLSGGSILGDKTRMAELSRNPKVFIRPSPSRGTFGGVTRNTSDVLTLCELAGFDMSVVETVGVGQSESMVASMVDMFIVLVAPAGGDELQGIKRGIMELADMVIVTKCDGDLEARSQATRAEYISALKYRHSQSSWRPRVLGVSSVTKRGMEDVWQAISDFYTCQKASGELFSRRVQRKRDAFHHTIHDLLAEKCMKLNPGILYDLEKKVMRSELTPTMAAENFLTFIQWNHSGT